MNEKSQVRFKYGLIFGIFIYLSLIQTCFSLESESNKGILYGSSFMIGVSETNNPQFQVNSKLIINNETFYGGEDMLGENTFGEKDLVLYPTYKFSVVFGEIKDLFIRNNKYYLTNSGDVWKRKLLLIYCNITEINDSNIEFAIYNGKNIIGRTKFNKNISIEYPIKTIN